jgi:hypothetical protein
VTVISLTEKALERLNMSSNVVDRPDQSEDEEEGQRPFRMLPIISIVYL